jgi:hypothetical protein
MRGTIPVDTRQGLTFLLLRGVPIQLLFGGVPQQSPRPGSSCAGCTLTRNNNRLLNIGIEIYTLRIASPGLG